MSARLLPMCIHCARPPGLSPDATQLLHGFRGRDWSGYPDRGDVAAMTIPSPSDANVGVESNIFLDFEMTNISLFPSVSVESSYIATHQREAFANGYDMPPAEHCGYTLIDGHLVPETFIQCVQEELNEHHFEYGQVLSEDCMFERDFLDSLDDHERSVLMPVVLILVARGDLGLNLWTAPRARIGGAK